LPSRETRQQETPRISHQYVIDIPFLSIESPSFHGPNLQISSLSCPEAVHKIHPNSHVFLFLPSVHLLIFSRGLCILVGFGWLFVLPLDNFSRRNYISENALLPGQVEAYFGGSELNIIKAYRAEVESWASSPDPNL
jgi:hypothetical protein